MSHSRNSSNSSEESRPSSRNPDPETLGKKFQRVKKIVEEATDVREERVAAAKQLLKRGQLKLEGEEIADKILSDPLNQVDIEI